MASSSYPRDITKEGFIGGATVLFVVAVVFVAIRFEHSWHQRKRLSVDDYISVAALIIQAVSVVLWYDLMTIGMNPTASSALISARIFLAQAFMGSVAMWIAKLPVLILFARIFGIKRWVRLVCYTTIALTSVLVIGSLIPVCVVCAPDGRVLDMRYYGTCITISLDICFSHGIVAVVTDLIILIVPLPIVMSLKLSLYKRAGLGLVFLAGSVAVAASVVSLYYKALNFRGDTSPTYTPTVLIMVEVAVALIVGCVPAARSFWLRRFTQTVKSSQRYGAQSDNSTDHIIRQGHDAMKTSISMAPVGGGTLQPPANVLPKAFLTR